MRKKQKAKKKISERLKRYHLYYKRTGLYPFLFKNILKMIFILLAFVGAFFIVDWLVDLAAIQSEIQTMVNQQNPIFVYILFYISESILGLIPPDIFIIWGKYFDYPYLVVTLLATISYIGGITAFKIGKLISRFPRIQTIIKNRYEANFYLIKKWGGVVIVLAALFPLPFATISTVAGMVNYPFRNFLYFGLTRYIRFYLYAIPIYNAMNNYMN